jgi:hypothetical protein
MASVSEQLECLPYTLDTEPESAEKGEGSSQRASCSDSASAAPFVLKTLLDRKASPYTVKRMTALESTHRKSHSQKIDFPSDVAICCDFP